MNTKTLLAALVGGIAAFILGFIIFGLLLMHYFEAHYVQYAGFAKDKPNLPVIFIANLIIAWMFAIIMQWSNMRGFMKGATIGAIIGGLVVLQADLFLWSLYNYYTDFTIIIVDVLINIVFSAIIGGIVGWMMGMGKQAAAKA